MCKNRSKKGRIILKFALKYEPGTKPGIYCQAGPFASFMLGPSITHTTFAAINIIQKLLDGITSVAKLLSNSNPFEGLGSHFCSLMFFFFYNFHPFLLFSKNNFSDSELFRKPQNEKTTTF